ncbi:MAG: hypothetical protein ACQEWI_14960 [Bacillota bacterium]
MAGEVVEVGEMRVEEFVELCSERGWIDWIRQSGIGRIGLGGASR